MTLPGAFLNSHRHLLAVSISGISSELAACPKPCLCLRFNPSPHLPLQCDSGTTAEYRCPAFHCEK